jgi:hypothetical protein
MPATPPASVEDMFVQTARGVRTDSCSFMMCGGTEAATAAETACRALLAAGARGLATGRAGGRGLGAFRLFLGAGPVDRTGWTGAGWPDSGQRGHASWPRGPAVGGRGGLADPPPPSRAAVPARQASAALVAVVTLGIVLLCLACAGRWMLERRRLADWERGLSSAPCGPGASGPGASALVVR